MNCTAKGSAASSCPREVSGAGAGATGAGVESADAMQQPESPQPQAEAAPQSRCAGDAKPTQCDSTKARLKRMVKSGFTLLVRLRSWRFESKECSSPVGIKLAGAWMGSMRTA